MLQSIKDFFFTKELDGGYFGGAEGALRFFALGVLALLICGLYFVFGG